MVSRHGQNFHRFVRETFNLLSKVSQLAPGNPSLLGRHGGNNKAHFPWGQGNDYDRLFDPVAMMLKREDKGQTHKKSHAPVSCEYLFNPYLESLLSGEIVGCSETACPEFPEKFRKLQRRRQKRCAD